MARPFRTGLRQAVGRMVEAALHTVNLQAFSGSTIRGGSAIPGPPAPPDGGDVQRVARWLRSRSQQAPFWLHLSMRVMPPRCLFCGQSADLGRVDLCLDCLEALPWFGNEIGTISASGGFIERQNVLVPLQYASPVDAALRDLKFHGDLAPARVLGAVLAAVAALRGPLPDLLVPVPLHADRLHERGFNQAAHLAQAAARWLGRPCATHLLERRRPTQPQTSLEAAARRRNVVGAFVMSAGAPRWLRRQAPAARHLTVVDDVLTTGATIQAAAAALQGFETVSCWAVARPLSNSFTPDPPAT